MSFNTQNQETQPETIDFIFHVWVIDWSLNSMKFTEILLKRPSIFFHLPSLSRFKILAKLTIQPSIKKLHMKTFRYLFENYSWVPNRRVYSFIWHQRNMKKKQTQRQTKVFNKNPPYSFIWPYSSGLLLV